MNQKKNRDNFIILTVIFGFSGKPTASAVFSSFRIFPHCRYSQSETGKIRPETMQEKYQSSGFISNHFYNRMLRIDKNLPAKNG